MACTLLFFELVCVATGIFPPVYETGDATLGWGPIQPGRVALDSCIDGSSGRTIEYPRNEIGLRTERSLAEILAHREDVKIAVVGDSHTDLCAPNELTHPGILERGLAEHGIDATVLSYGVARYSPLQAYLLFREKLRSLGPRILVLNLYTGNDFNDLLRPDDRPHFVRAGDTYRIEGPVWYRHEAPGTRHWSRLAFLARSIGAASGLQNLYARFRLLSDMAGERGQGYGTVLAYLRDLRRSVEPSLGYPEALTAQMLNQQLFFHHFQGTRDESVRRVGFLMQRVRDENPGLLLVMSPLPSYELAAREPVDAALLATLRRLPLKLENGVAEEQGLYDELRHLATEHGWVFIDNLTALRAYRGNERLYNDFDYHLTPAASEIIGTNEAAALEPLLRRR